MRNLVRILAIFIFAGLPLITAGASTPTTVTLSISNMTCSLCPVTVNKALQKVKGVISTKAMLATQTAVVSYDPTLTNPQALIKATTDAGYPAKIKG
ncbi:MAG TPA: cation transporter [Burkholderiales bacterium]|jgi:mercuric ion binding protein|nr:cation transporter [Burkholderiales bacterium]